MQNKSPLRPSENVAFQYKEIVTVPANPSRAAVWIITCLKTKDHNQLIYTQGYKKGSRLQRNTLKAFFPQAGLLKPSPLQVHFMSYMESRSFSHPQHKLPCHFYSLNSGGMGQRFLNRRKTLTDSPLWGSLSLLSPSRSKIEILDLKQKELFQRPTIKKKKNLPSRKERLAVSNVTKLFTLQRLA